MTDGLVPNGEQDLFKSAAKCDKDGAGIIHLTNLRILWTKDGITRNVHIRYADVESQMVSKQATSKVPLMKVSFKENNVAKSHVFEFMGSDPQAAWKDRDRCSDMVAGFMKQFSKPTGPTPNDTPSRTTTTPPTVSTPPVAKANGTHTSPPQRPSPDTLPLYAPSTPHAPTPQTATRTPTPPQTPTTPYTTTPPHTPTQGHPSQSGIDILNNLHGGHSTTTGSSFGSTIQMQDTLSAQHVATSTAVVTNPMPKVPAAKSASLSEQEAMQRASLLVENKELRTLYDQLVKTGTISAEEFWESRRTMLQNEVQKSANQPKGIPSALLADVRPTAANSNTVQYKLTPATIHQIFIMYPNVQKLYNELVPTKMNEKEFWTNYFQTLRMYREGRVATISTQRSDDVFMKVASEQEKDQQEPIVIKRKLKHVDPTVDISADTTTVGFGLTVDPNMNPQKMTKNLSLLRRFNRHAALVLGSTIDEESPNKKQKLETSEIHAKIQEELKLSDLEANKPSDNVPLNIENSKVYFDSRADGEKTNELSVPQYIKLFQNEVTNWTPTLERATVKDSLAATVLAEVTTSQKVQSHESSGAEEELPVSDDIKTELYFYFSTANELLRHFWSAYSQVPDGVHLNPGTPLGQKVKKIADSLSKLYDKINDFRKEKTTNMPPDKRSHIQQVILPIIQTLDKAFDRHPPQQ